MITCTTSQAADLIGVSPVTIRRWVMKGWLAPIQPAARPLRFNYADVLRASRTHQPTRHQHLDTLWQRILDGAHTDKER